MDVKEIGWESMVWMDFTQNRGQALVNMKMNSKFFHSPTDAQVNCLKNNFKIYIKPGPTCFGAVTPSSGSALLMLAKVTTVTLALFALAKFTTVTLASTSNALPDYGVTAPKHVGAFLMSILT